MHFNNDCVGISFCCENMENKTFYALFCHNASDFLDLIYFKIESSQGRYKANLHLCNFITSALPNPEKQNPAAHSHLFDVHTVFKSTS